jgi:RecJ-like exonuclease
MRVEIECPHCQGKGYHTDYTGNCKNNSNNCCGGCEKEIECNNCQGSGLLDVDPIEHFEDECLILENTILTFIKSMKAQGLNNKTIKSMVAFVTNENL